MTIGQRSPFRNWVGGESHETLRWITYYVEQVNVPRETDDTILTAQYGLCFS